jgi:hypothetical protein
MFRRRPVIILLVATAVSTGCRSSDGDALAREKASMEAEAKALAEHKASPVPVPERPGLPVKDASQNGTRLPAGTLLKVVTTQSLSTRSASTGQDWTGKLAEDLKDGGGKVLAKAGSDIRGRVVLVSDGSNIRRKHELEIRVYQLLAASGKPVDVRTTILIREGANGGKRPAIIENQERLDFQLASSTVFP